MAAFSAFAGPGHVTLKVHFKCEERNLMTMKSQMMGSSLFQVQSYYPSSKIACKAIHGTYASLAATNEAHEKFEEKSHRKGYNSLAPNSFEVQNLLMEVCDETSVAEFTLKVGDFKLHVKRDAAKMKGSTSPVVLAPDVPSKQMVESMTTAGSALIAPPPAPKSHPSSTAALLATPALKSGSRFGLLEVAADKGLHFVTSPKVGLFQTSQVVKGKSGRPLCEEGQLVKEGQVVCYVEQLGTRHPVQADNSGEIMKILCKDGEPVGYGDPLIAIRPSFAGISEPLLYTG
ncbi:hypothetical protein KP509_07G036300 [Ceratopteris richardii]|uniref:Lipoyl-binding domain-containing protein n=2 Tax=Ceratopteris richardii TaxID=49495 RepID=A0A8T2UK62_CERRI|nr:hypothetical protein KP509_07G036300 [Ceratopteris richardii]